jgi:hypothetical protein
MNPFEGVLYLLAIVTSLACTVLLYRGYVRRRLRLLMWSAICFLGLSINNILVFADLVMFPDVDLRPARLLAALAALVFLLYGFIWDSE